MPKTLTKEEFIKLIYNKFGDKFLLTVPDEFTLNSYISADCPLHGKFTIKGVNLLHNSTHGCGDCGRIARAESNKKNAALMSISLSYHVEQFNKLYNNFYTYPEQTIKNSQSKISIICPNHGIFTKHLHAHHKGSGCQKCRTEETKKHKKSIISVEERAIVATSNRTFANKNRILKINEVEALFRASHGDTFIYYWDTYMGVSKKIKIGCPSHGEFWQDCGEHIKSAHGCPTCAIGAKSKKELAWLSQFPGLTPQYKIQLDSGIAIVDGYNPTTNTVYEFLGDYWHGHPRYHNKFNGINPTCKISFIELFKGTEIRLTKLQQMCYNIKYVWESDTSSLILRNFDGKLDF